MKSTNLSEPLKRESASGRSEPPQSTLESSDSTFPTKVIIIAPSAISYDESPQLGTGGFGVVRKAQFEGQTVAIKKFIIDRESDDVVTKAALFLTEAKNMRELNHPRIVR